MGVDWYSCSRCNDTYCDCGDYERCSDDLGGCGREWCSSDCAYEDGHRAAKCKLDNEPDSYCEEIKDYCSGEDCEHFIPESCSYCRGEAFEDYEILNKALEMSGLTKDKVIEELKKRNKH